LLVTVTDIFSCELKTKIMITEKEYLEAQMIIKLYESHQLNISGGSGSSIPKPPEPPKDRRWRDGDEPPKPKNYR
jgi:hypothetical protein